MKTSKYITGFNLLELIVVIAIIGILSTLAIPVYQNYTAKTQIYSAYISLSALKRDVELLILQHQSTTKATDLGWKSGESYLMSNDPIISISHSTGQASINGVLDKKVNSAVLNSELNLSRSPDGQWYCYIKRPSHNGWKDEFAPKSCSTVSP